MNPVLSFRKVIEAARREGRRWLDTLESLTLVEAYGIPVAPYDSASNLDELLDSARRLGYPIVVKPVASSMLHKTELGAVKLNLKSDEEAEEAFKDLRKSLEAKGIPFEKVLVQRMLSPGLEVAVGGLYDEQFAQVVMLGFGGILIEVYRDVVFRVAPISKAEAYEMMRELKGYPIIKGYRGTGPYDEEALADILTKVSGLLMENPEIKELDLNPIILYGRGGYAADSRILLK
ncbi:MAG: acetate--CoA ligase family protein [Candidatus Bathyarchaeia archaeon]